MNETRRLGSERSGRGGEFASTDCPYIQCIQFSVGRTQNVLWERPGQRPSEEGCWFFVIELEVCVIVLSFQENKIRTG